MSISHIELDTSCENYRGINKKGNYSEQATTSFRYQYECQRLKQGRGRKNTDPPFLWLIMLF